MKIDDSLVVKEETEVLEDLLIAAINDANKKVKENASAQMNNFLVEWVYSGMKLPF